MILIMAIVANFYLGKSRDQIVSVDVVSGSTLI